MKRLLTILSVLSVILIFSGCERYLFGISTTSKVTPTANDEFTNPDETVTEDKAPINKTTSMSQTTAPKSGDKIAVIKTTQGFIKVRLFPEQAPETVKNFEELAKDGKYNGTIFHRVIKDFMIQGGDFENRNGTGGYSYKGPGTMINDEFDPNLKNLRGSLSMANRGPNTNGSQFFIVHAESTPWLDGKHTVFGQVFEGMDVLDKIATTEVGPMDKPVTDQVLQSIEITTY